MNNQIMISKYDYNELKTMADNATSTYARSRTEYIYYNHEEDHFFATDYHMARLHYIKWNEESKKPEYNFLIPKSSFLLSSKQIKEKFKGEELIPLEIITEKSSVMEYPDYMKIIPDDTPNPQTYIGISPSRILQYCKSYKIAPIFLELRMGSAVLAPIKVFIANLEGARIFSGLISHIRINNSEKYITPKIE